VDVVDQRDYAGDDVPHAAKLLARRIAIATGPAGPYLVRANSVLVEAPDDDHLARLRHFAHDIGCHLRLDLENEARTVNSHATIEFEPRPYEARQLHGRRGVDDDRSTSGRAGRGPHAGRPRWSVEGIVDASRRLVDGGFAAKANHVYMCDTVFTGNPGAYLSNANGAASNASSAMPSGGPFTLSHEIVLGDRPRPNVLVLDTGLATTLEGSITCARHEFLRGDRLVLREPWRNDPTGVVDDEDEPDDDPSTSDGIGIVDRAAGHGTFIAGIVRRLCPEANVYIEGVLSSFGDGDDNTVGQGIEHATHALGRPFDVIIMSLGCYTADDRPPPLADTVAANIGAGTVVVASAGNEASARPQYPAALPDVVSVGALGPAGRATFSNFGPWVDACAPGVDVLSTYLFHEETGGPRRSYDGYATWSGTSFAAPKVAAAIARAMYTSMIPNDTARAAWHRLSSGTPFGYPDLGLVFNIV
jgi:subtilisin family serine protease